MYDDHDGEIFPLGPRQARLSCAYMQKREFLLRKWPRFATPLQSAPPALLPCIISHARCTTAKLFRQARLVTARVCRSVNFLKHRHMCPFPLVAMHCQSYSLLVRDGQTQTVVSLCCAGYTRGSVHGPTRSEPTGQSNSETNNSFGLSRHHFADDLRPMRVSSLT